MATVSGMGFSSSSSFGRMKASQKKTTVIGGGVNHRCLETRCAASDPYKTLRISPDATASEVKKAFRRLALKYHPDVCREANSLTKFQKINEAYNMAMNNLKTPAAAAKKNNVAGVGYQKEKVAGAGTVGYQKKEKVAGAGVGVGYQKPKEKKVVDYSYHKEKEEEEEKRKVKWTADEHRYENPYYRNIDFDIEDEDEYLQQFMGWDASPHLFRNFSFNDENPYVSRY